MKEEEFTIRSRVTRPPADSGPPTKPKPFQPDPLHRRQFGRPTPKDWYHFSLELRTMLEAGVGITQALTLLEKTSERHRVKKAAAAMARALSSRQGIAAAVDAGDDLPQLMRALLILGSRAGRVVEMLDLVIRHYRWMLDIRSQILRAVWYPAALVILGGLIMVGRDTTIAVLHRGVGTMEALLRYGWVYFGPIIIGSALGLTLATVMKLRKARPVLDRVILTVPLLGSVAKKYALAVFFEVLAACIEAGMPIGMGYSLAAQSTTNRVIGERLEEGLDYLRDGESLGETLRMSGVLDVGSLGMIRAGESAAEVPFLMRKMAGHYTMELQSSVTAIVKVIMPLMIPLVGAAYFVNAEVLGWLAFALTFLLVLI